MRSLTSVTMPGSESVSAVDKTTRSVQTFTVLSVLLLLASSGCHFTPPKPTAFWKWKKDQAPIVPERILAVWSDSVLHQPGKPGVRGFGGRIYFYQTEGSDPIKADGALAVYVFDADQLDPYQQKPLRKFMFTADQFSEHYSSTTLGPSYSVWLPWDEVGGQAKRLSLIARFEGREGGTVISDPTVKLLPGVTSLADEKRNTGESESNNPVRAVGHQTRTSQPVIPPGILQRRDIQTIELPPSFQKHLEEQPSGVPTELPKLRLKPPSSQPGHPSDSANATPEVVPTQLAPPPTSPLSLPSPSRGKRDIREGKPISAPRQG